MRALADPAGPGGAALAVLGVTPALDLSRDEVDALRMFADAQGLRGAWLRTQLVSADALGVMRVQLGESGWVRKAVARREKLEQAARRREDLALDRWAQDHPADADALAAEVMRDDGALFPGTVDWRRDAEIRAEMVRRLGCGGGAGCFPGGVGAGHAPAGSGPVSAPPTRPPSSRGEWGTGGGGSLTPPPPSPFSVAALRERYPLEPGATRFERERWLRSPARLRARLDEHAAAHPGWVVPAELAGYLDDLERAVAREDER